jgi:hypothetical protein
VPTSAGGSAAAGAPCWGSTVQFSRYHWRDGVVGDYETSATESFGCGIKLVKKTLATWRGGRQRCLAGHADRGVRIPVEGRVMPEFFVFL